MADIEAINRLHQAANSFLQEIGVGQGMMAESLGDVSSQPNVGGGQAVLEGDILLKHRANARHADALR